MKESSFSKGIYYGRLWGKNRQIKERLVAEYGICYWCKRKVTIYQATKGQTLPPDNATLDHLKSRIVGREKGELTPKVLACKKCNESRAIEEKINKKQNDRNTILRIL